MTNNTDESALSLLIVNDKLRADITALIIEKYVCNEFSTLDSMLNDASETSVALILISYEFLVDKEKETLALIKQHWPEANILVIGPKVDIKEQVQILRYGARGYFDVNLMNEKLCFALNSIVHGEVWVERHVISGLIDQLSQPPELIEEDRQKLALLSPKEREVSNLVSHGATNKIIANKMNITERTVKAHLTTIYQKMSIPDRLSLAIFFRDLR
jgi:two-component system nitrate/nitrite response regulator NarL